ncbi:winged helix-turn-helix domain-containing protein [Rhodococcus sp. NPDC060086]|uniref:winged helix-turn-helix domain-containing protein n=1 Tax=unclassified Rhodococcus (in: high G+C Gram-positive bacteria) TaxID=192944 RepID=UPI00364FA00B
MDSSARTPTATSDPAAPQRPLTGLRAMVVEDEAPLATLIGSYLERDGFETAITGDGADAVTLARQVDPDVVVLDLGLPHLDGVEVCRQLRTFSDAYVVMLTARTEEIDTLIGLSVGADDYMSKPFSPRELMARIQAMLRRPRTGIAAPRPAESAAADLVHRVGDLALDVDGREVTVAGMPVALTRTEFDVLAALARDPGVVLTRAQLIEAVWGPSWTGDEHLVDVHIGHLRRKLCDDATRGRYVRTVRGVGYRMGTGA